MQRCNNLLHAIMYYYHTCIFLFNASCGSTFLIWPWNQYLVVSVQQGWREEEDAQGTSQFMVQSHLHSG